MSRETSLLRFTKGVPLDGDKPSSRVELRFHGVRRGLQIKDAVILEQLLMLEPSYAARRLASRLTAAIVTGSQVKLNLATHQSTLRRDLID